MYMYACIHVHVYVYVCVYTLYMYNHVNMWDTNTCTLSLGMHDSKLFQHQIFIHADSTFHQQAQTTIDRNLRHLEKWLAYCQGAEN